MIGKIDPGAAEVRVESTPMISQLCCGHEAANYLVDSCLLGASRASRRLKQVTSYRQGLGLALFHHLLYTTRNQLRSQLRHRPRSRMTKSRQNSTERRPWGVSYPSHEESRVEQGVPLRQKSQQQQQQQLRQAPRTSMTLTTSSIPTSANPRGGHHCPRANGHASSYAQRRERR